MFFGGERETGRDRERRTGEVQGHISDALQARDVARTGVGEEKKKKSPRLTNPNQCPQLLLWGREHRAECLQAVVLRMAAGL